MLKAKDGSLGGGSQLISIILVKENMPRTKRVCFSKCKVICVPGLKMPQIHSSCIMSSPNRSMGITLLENLQSLVCHTLPKGLNTEEGSENMSANAPPPHTAVCTLGTAAARLLRRGFGVKYSFQVSLN